MVKIKLDTMEITCNHEAAEYIVSLCESALLTISKSGSDSQYRKCDNFIKAIYNAIDADYIAISYDEYRGLRGAATVYCHYLLFKDVPVEQAFEIIDLLNKGTYKKHTNEISYSADDFAIIMHKLKYAYESESFEFHFKWASRVIADFYEKYKAAL